MPSPTDPSPRSRLTIQGATAQQFMRDLMEHIELYRDSEFLRENAVEKNYDELIYTALEEMNYPRLAVLAWQLGVSGQYHDERCEYVSIEAGTRGVLNLVLCDFVRTWYRLDPYKAWR